MPKKTMRSSMLARRRTLGADLWQAASWSAQQQVLALGPFQQAARIALYASLGNEIDTTLLFAAARLAGKQLYYPLVCNDRLAFHQIIALEQLRLGSFGILEPCPVGSGQTHEQMDLIVVPGVAFDLQGHRIGFGKGYYDRYLADMDPLPMLVGLCHDFQLCPEVPAEGHDIRMDYVVTEFRVVHIRQ